MIVFDTHRREETLSKIQLRKQGNDQEARSRTIRARDTNLRILRNNAAARNLPYSKSLEVLQAVTRGQHIQEYSHWSFMCHDVFVRTGNE